MPKPKKEKTLKQLLPNAKNSKKFDTVLKDVDAFLKDKGHLKNNVFLSGVTFAADGEGECIRWETVTETRPDPLRPGKTIVVVVRRCVETDAG